MYQKVLKTAIRTGCILLGIFLFLNIVNPLVANAENNNSKPVIYLHDGAIDEYVSYLLLSTMDSVDLKGVIIVNADCIDIPAVNTQWKFQQFTGQTDIPVALSRARGWNPFPWDFRKQCIQQGNVGLLNDYESAPGYPSGEKLLKKSLKRAIKNKEPVTLLVNCPLTPLYLVLSKNPELEKGIKRLIWMGGAINVPGNLGNPPAIPKQAANQEAEWNVFWDPSSTKWVFKNTSFPIIEFPLDITDNAKITKEFLTKLKKQGEKYKYSRLAFQSYSIITGLSEVNQAGYEMWDVLTTTFLEKPGLITNSSELKLDVITEGKKQGALVKKKKGRKVRVMFEFDHDSYYKYVLQKFKK